MGRLSEVYETEGSCYWVVESSDGRIVGGAGVGPWSAGEGICELQKMYFLKEARANGIAQELLQLILQYAKVYYKKCYIETLHNMEAANKFYRKHGFIQLEKPLSQTEHYACDVWYIKEL